MTRWALLLPGNTHCLHTSRGVDNVVQRSDLMKRLRHQARARGVEMVLTEGAKHTKVVIGEARTVVPRHSEINERTARAILKQMGVPR